MLQLTVTTGKIYGCHFNVTVANIKNIYGLVQTLGVPNVTIEKTIFNIVPDSVYDSGFSIAGK